MSMKKAVKKALDRIQQGDHRRERIRVQGNKRKQRRLQKH